MRNGDWIPETGDRKGEAFSPASGLPSPISRGLVVSAARSYLGTPFHHQGRLKGVGVDCVGLIVCVLRDLGVEANDSFDYNGHPDSAFLLNKLREHLIEIRIDEAKPGDIYLMRIGKNPQHLAFVSSQLPVVGMGLKPACASAASSIIHTHKSAACVIEVNLWGWNEALCAAFEIPGVEE